MIEYFNELLDIYILPTRCYSNLMLTGGISFPISIKHGYSFARDSTNKIKQNQSCRHFD